MIPPPVRAENPAPPARADYGIDAPPVIRNLMLGAMLAAAVIIASTLDPGIVKPSLRMTAIVTAAVCAGEAALMVWGSRVGKLRLRDRLLDELHLGGGETVLDVGCGRGLLLVGAARRLPVGRALGIDLWRAGDLSGNAAEQTLANARAEGVADRVELRTGDMRALPFDDDSVDMAVSNLAIHNVPGAEGRRAAVREIARVVKPGGRVTLVDFGGTALYERTLRELGWTVQRSGLSFWIFPPVRVVRGRKPE
jgi:arsenite methyltransferase